MDDLPPDINEEIHNESEIEDDAEEIFNEGDVGDDGDAADGDAADGVAGDADAENGRRRTRGSMFNARSSFMTGKFIRLQPTPVPPLDSKLLDSLNARIVYLRTGFRS